jgi:arylsulfatase
MPGGPDTYVAYGQGWANVSNTPFREYKHWVHEGGISTPLIAHWPAGIPRSRVNTFVTDPGHLVDIMATCVDVAGTTYPSVRNGQIIVPMQGISLRRAFQGKPLNRREPLFWEHEGNRAVRDGKWKLVAKDGQPWELYDMEADRTEMHDLAATRPELVQDLARKWGAWAEHSNVLPLGTWRNKPVRPDTARVRRPAAQRAAQDIAATTTTIKSR